MGCGCGFHLSGYSRPNVQVTLRYKPRIFDLKGDQVLFVYFSFVQSAKPSFVCSK